MGPPFRTGGGFFWEPVSGKMRRTLARMVSTVGMSCAGKRFRTRPRRQGNPCTHFRALALRGGCTENARARACTHVHAHVCPFARVRAHVHAVAQKVALTTVGTHTLGDTHTSVRTYVRTLARPTRPPIRAPACPHLTTRSMGGPACGRPELLGGLQTCGENEHFKEQEN